MTPPLVCEAGESACDFQCVDVSRDPLHCGACGQPCLGGTRCEAGTCVCPSGETNCAGACVDLETDAGNCGMCGRTCLDGKVCEAGLCGCPPSFDLCGDTCVDFESDAAHCGSCDFSCSPLQSCVARSCGCGDLNGCPGGETGFCSTDLERHCCSGSETFCDVNAAVGYPGGCVVAGFDCASATDCGGTVGFCLPNQTPECSTTNVLSCCDAARPVFCDSVPAIGWDGGCWPTDTACTSITPCGNTLFACPIDTSPHCSGIDQPHCCPAGFPLFCDTQMAIGYDGGCWPSTIACNTITECNGQFVACPPGTTPNCNGQCV